MYTQLAKYMYFISKNMGNRLFKKNNFLNPNHEDGTSKLCCGRFDKQAMVNFTNGYETFYHLIPYIASDYVIPYK